MRPRFRFSGMFVLPVVLALLLGGLAVMQYRWVGQLSIDERDRIREHLKSSADEFAEDFNRELTRAFFWLQIGPEVKHEEPPESDAQRYERWFAAAARPDLIKTVYQVDLDAAGHPVLQQFYRQEPRLEPAEWPEVLTPLRTAIAERHEVVSGSQEPPPQGGPGTPLTRLPWVWPDVPALLIPRARVVQTVNGRQVTAPAPNMPAGYVIALLNSSYIRQQLIPQLADRHFTKGPDGALQVAIKSGSTNEIVYATPGAIPNAIEHADVTQALWDIRFFEFNRFVTDRRAVTERIRVEGPGSDRGPGDRGPGDRGGPNDRDHGQHANVAPPPPPSAPGPNTANITLMFTRDDRGRGGPRGAAAGLPVWHVHLLHGAGSLDAAVGRARWRNLLVSFGVLLLLGASVTLVLISSARARRLAAQQMEFVAGVSHELRTPLAVIRSAAENLADGIVDDEKQVRRYGQLIAGEGRRLTQMVEQVMTFAGLQAGRPGFDVRPIEVGPVVDDAVAAVAPVARDEQAEIACDVATALPRVMADPSAVGRALQNLLGNAVKYGGAPPRIRVTARMASPSLRGGEVLVTVSDSGPGIAPRDLPHIFEPFYRGSDAVSKQIHGSGLGLSLVQRIMQELGGRVTVKSEPGQGSAFTLHLPVAPETELAAQSAPMSEASRVS
jgi:signal transduction histidine kinase